MMPWTALHPGGPFYVHHPTRAVTFKISAPADAATRRSDINAAAKRVMLAKAELKRLEKASA